MNILIYSPDNGRAVDQQSQAELLLSLQHKVYLLTWKPAGILHENFTALGAQAFSSAAVKGRSIFFFIKQAIFLARFCKQHNIDVVFSNLQPNAFVAGIAHFFMPARMFYIRHNADYFQLRSSWKDKLINHFANKFSPAIIAISDNVKTALVKEGVPPRKIVRINLCYNFEQYNAGRKFNAAEIRGRFHTGMLISYIARLDSLKGHIKAFEAIKQLSQQGINCTLLCIGEGEYRKTLEDWIVRNGMQQQIILEGFVTNVFDYMEAADVVLLLSESEASNNVVKEAGMCKRTAIVCKGVGDFESYIEAGKNGFLVEKGSSVPGTVNILKQLCNDKEKLKIMGNALHIKVENKFSMAAVKQSYINLLDNK